MLDKKKLRVLCLGRFCDDEPGGTQTHVANLFQALGHQVEYTNLVPARRARSDVITFAGVTTYRVAAFKLESSVYISPLMLWKLWRLHARQKFDVVHLHFPDPMSHLASMLLPRQVGRVITWHSDIIRQKTMLRLYRPFLLASLRRASSIIVPTPAHITSSEILVNLEKDLKIRIVPFGFDFSSLLRIASETSTKAPLVNSLTEEFKVFALGRHVYYKGFDVLIRAIAVINEPIKLILGGDGPLSAHLKNLTKDLGIEHKVIFTGRLNDRQLAECYRVCDAFCLPAVAKTEAFGIVQVEAMAFGKPVVSTRLGNGVDFVNQHEETGLLAEPGDLDSLVSCLLRLVRDPELCKSLGECGFQKAMSEYSLANMGKQTLDAYESAASSQCFN